MLRRCAVRLALGIPATPEPKGVQKDARQYVNNSEYEFISRPEDELTWVIPKGWAISSPHGRVTLGTGETLTEYMCHPQETNQVTNVMQLQVNHAFGVVTTSLPPYALNQSHGYRMARVGPFFKQWMEMYKHSIDDAGTHTDFKFIQEFPCTYLNEEPAVGEYGYSIAKQKATGTNTVQYYRLFFHDDYARFTVAMYQAGEEVFEQHLAHRWFGLNLLESVRATTV